MTTIFPKKLVAAFLMFFNIFPDGLHLQVLGMHVLKEIEKQCKKWNICFEIALEYFARFVTQDS